MAPAQRGRAAALFSFIWLFSKNGEGVPCGHDTLSGMGMGTGIGMSIGMATGMAMDYGLWVYCYGIIRIIIRITRQ